MRTSTPAFVIVLAAVVALAGAVVLFGWFGLQRSYYLGTYVCTQCGAEETVHRREFAGLVYHQETEIRNTPVSRVLAAHQTRGCRHDWHLLRFGSGSGPVVGGWEQADGGTPFLTGHLLAGDMFAGDLAATPQPREVWAALWRAGEAEPEKTDDLLDEWGGPAVEPFAQWWARNGGRVRELGERGES